jgi:hypothetical protein
MSAGNLPKLFHIESIQEKKLTMGAPTSFTFYEEFQQYIECKDIYILIKYKRIGYFHCVDDILIQYNEM